VCTCGDARYWKVIDPKFLEGPEVVAVSGGSPLAASLRLGGGRGIWKKRRDLLFSSTIYLLRLQKRISSFSKK
jgi:hypothetical protein